MESKGVGKTFAYLEWKNVEYLEKMEYLSGGPELNPLNYSVWAELKRVVYSGGEINDLAELTHPLTVAWQNLSMAPLKKAVAEYHDSI